jgi:putative ATPase
MSSVSDLFAQAHSAPLAEALRPKTLDEVIGPSESFGEVEFGKMTA